MLKLLVLVILLMASLPAYVDEGCRDYFVCKELAEKGDVSAQYQLGRMYLEGELVPVNLKEALIWYTKAAQAKSPEAQFGLAGLYRNGSGTPVDLDQMEEWYSKAANQGYAPAQYILGLLYYYANEGHRALEMFLRAAQQGYAPAEYQVSYMYFSGEKIEEDPVQAYLWYSKATAQGYDLGLMQYFGYSSTLDESKIFSLLHDAAESGHVLAQFKLGMAWLNGSEGADQIDLKKATFWLEQAATSDSLSVGYPLAQYELGRLFDDADTSDYPTEMVEQSKSERRINSGYWYAKAADSGVKEAQTLLGLRLIDKRKSRDEGKAWLEKAALQGSKESLNRLLEFFISNKNSGEIENKYAWLSVGATLKPGEGQPGAKVYKKKLKKLEKKMTEEELEKAQSLSLEYFEAISNNSQD